jgi:hypothetical protein
LPTDSRALARHIPQKISTHFIHHRSLTANASGHNAMDTIAITTTSGNDPT